MKIEPMTRMTPNQDGTPLNPFTQDIYRMGTKLGKNIALMFPNFEDEHCPYFIIINTITGERNKILIN